MIAIPARGPWTCRSRLWSWGAALLVATGCTALDPMQFQQKVDPYTASRFYPDGLAMRDPPADTVPHRAALDPAAASGRDREGKLVQAIPVAVTPRLLETGRKRFEIYCAVCHGLVGDGRSVVATKMSLRPPPSLHDFRDRPDGFFYQVISEGFGLMPSYAQQLSIEERWAVVAYVRAL